MAAASYVSDLTDLLTDMSGTTGWTALGTGASGLVAPETDFFIQGSNCISKAGWSTATKGMIYGMGAGQTVASDKAVFMWIYFWAANSMAAETSGGMQLLIGSSAAAFKQWYVRGNDTLTYGGWVCAVVDPTVAADATTGSPTATLQFFGSQVNVPSAGPGKGQPLGIDAFRHGRDFTCTNGDLANGYATFSGAATYNDNSTRRYGQIQAIDGGYLQQGRFLMGSAATAVDFRDSNKSILIANTKKVSSPFNAFEEQNASSNVQWTNISITALGTVSKGTLTITTGTFAATSCTFTDMGMFTFNSSSTVSNTTFRRCSQITGGGGTFNACTISNSTTAISLVLTNLNQITNCTFESDGTNHVVNLGTISSSISMNWNNYLTSYATNNGSSGNEAILVSVASGQTLSINVGTGYSTPSVYNTGLGTVTVVSGQVTTSVTVKDLTTGNNVEGARVLVWATDNANKFYNASVAITGNGTTATVTHTGHGLVTGDKVIISGVTNDDDYNGVFSITYINPSSYSYTADDTLTSPATGIPVAKWAIISGVTNSSGYIEDVRSFGSPQPVTGWARKTSAAPYYQEGIISGTISIANGFSSTTQLARDE